MGWHSSTAICPHRLRCTFTHEQSPVHTCTWGEQARTWSQVMFLITIITNGRIVPTFLLDIMGNIKDMMLKELEKEFGSSLTCHRDPLLTQACTHTHTHTHRIVHTLTTDQSLVTQSLCTALSMSWCCWKIIICCFGVTHTFLHRLSFPFSRASSFLSSPLSLTFPHCLFAFNVCPSVSLAAFLSSVFPLSLAPFLGFSLSHSLSISPFPLSLALCLWGRAGVDVIWRPWKQFNSV